MLLESTADMTIENNFWSQDKLALNILLGRLEESNNSTIAIQNYFTKRAQIEEEYGNQLLALAESSHQIEECFSTILTSSELSARAHVDLGQNIRNMLELPLKSYLTDQENIKIFMTNQMKEAQDLKLSQLEHVEKTRQRYVDECQNPNTTFESIDVLDCEYQKAINEMRANSVHWIHEWRDSCKTFQSLELQRMDYLKAVIKTFSSMITCTFSIDDQTCERMLITMEDFDVNHEMLNFVKGHRTGSSIPAIPKYKKFSQPLDVQRKKVVAPPVLTEKRTIREINIPIKQDEELRSVNDQLRKKLPASKPWEHPHDDDSSGSVHPYPLNPIYKSNKKSPSQSDPVLNNWYDNFQQAATLHTTTASPTSPTPKNKSTLVTPQEKAKYIQHINHSNVPTKKPSLLLSSISFFKKKKSAADNPRNKKRLSLSHAATDPLIPTTQQSENHKQPLEQPPSPMFSPIDFYYSPADIDRNLKKAIIPPPPPPTSP
ncbi:hypothetical protein HMPREF1544_02259 [Mucor circinelloides 1006PhL]|uniref:FCH domain-containing protein n=1 Tax=Mucor circinelloides f. circinelloides (strain 1006PhL) TaxID=1220926 RepID=S2JQR8_MUCC1|nr:hypothetical protein HMPREF1544_02259 [Mucor circinelloides 1006PhL]